MRHEVKLFEEKLHLTIFRKHLLSPLDRIRLTNDEPTLCHSGMIAALMMGNKHSSDKIKIPQMPLPLVIQSKAN
jgi:hypothetical protein